MTLREYSQENGKPTGRRVEVPDIGGVPTEAGIRDAVQRLTATGSDVWPGVSGLVLLGRAGGALTVWRA